MQNWILALLLVILLTINVNFLGPLFFKRAKKRITERFFQGRLTDVQEWKDKVTARCKKWLDKTPTLRSSDDTGQTVVTMLQKKQRKASIQVWQSGTLYLALKEAEESEHDSTTKKLLDNFERDAEKRFCLKKITDADYGLLCFGLLQNETSPGCGAMLDYIHNSVTPQGLILYKQNVKNVVFVDTLGFVCPFMVKYGIISGKTEYVEMAKRQFEIYFDCGTEKKSQLPFHAFSVDQGIPYGICEWGRGLAWLLIGLMDSYRCIRNANREDAYFCTTIKRYAKILIKLQRPGGGYTWQLLSGQQMDSSATAVFGWFLACCAQEFGEQEYLEYAVRCRDFLMNVTNSDGTIDYCQGDTIGVGVYSRSFDRMPFAQGFALRMEREIEQAEQKGKL